jgi:hypothetical protein
MAAWSSLKRSKQGLYIFKTHRKRRSKERDLVQAGFTDCRAAKNPPGILKIPAKSINILNN